MASKLDERKKKILKVVTDDYIESAEPVGSRSIARKYDLGLSPATIRNEMSDLEEGGYLEQPHTSAGRVPSEKGYRYYVDALMSLDHLSGDKIELIYKQLEKHHREIEAIIHETSKILVRLTQYPSMILGPQSQETTFRHIQLIKLSPNTILVLIVTDTGFIENKIIELENEITDEELDRLSNMINHKLRGISIKDLRNSVINEIRSEMVFHDHLFNEAIKLLIKAVGNNAQERIYLDGTTKILEQPEFSDIQKLKPLMRVLEEEDALYKLLTKNLQRGSKVKIGSENEELGMNDCSVVTAGYEIGGRTVGVIGVLGPTRMEYAKVLPIVEYTAGILSELLTEICKRGQK